MTPCFVERRWMTIATRVDPAATVRACTLLPPRYRPRLLLILLLLLLLTLCLHHLLLLLLLLVMMTCSSRAFASRWRSRLWLWTWREVPATDSGLQPACSPGYAAPRDFEPLQPSQPSQPPVSSPRHRRRLAPRPAPTPTAMPTSSSTAA